MGTVIEAVYDGETFRPLKKVNTPKGTKVGVIVDETIWDLLGEIKGIPVDVNIEKERGFVIDTNIIVGAFFYELRKKKEVLKKCRLILSLSKGKDIAIPRVEVVEVVSVVKRISGDQKLVIRLGNAAENSFEIVPEEELYDSAKEINCLLVYESTGEVDIKNFLGGVKDAGNWKGRTLHPRET